MRPLPFWVSLLVLLLVARAQAADFPYTAYINSDDVYIRSGPGKNYYPTAKLRRGEPVEVYRHDPGGWYAIRPPVQSFSWISARQLDLVDDGLAVINTDRAVARVGSLFSEVRDVIQVRLNKNERVELVDHHISSDEKWYKIAPPAGEFRWVYKDYVTHRRPEGELADNSDAEGSRGDDADADEDPEERPQTRRPKRRPVDEEIRLTSGDHDNDVADSRGSDRPRRPAQRGSMADDRKSFIVALSDIDLDLSAMVAEEITTWSFADLRLRTERVMRRAPTAIERGQAQHLLNRIDGFERLKARQDALLAVAEAPAGNVAGRSGPRGYDESASPRYDAMGLLAQIAPRKAGDPPFVLIDRRGNVISYVTASPNINLRPYVDRQVGITGQRGFMPELHKSHITAQRINVLPDEPRRQ